MSHKHSLGNLVEIGENALIFIVFNETLSNTGVIWMGNNHEILL
jgi:hypothetical protein